MSSVGDALRWDGDRLAQVVTNLLSNAVKYGFPGAGHRGAHPGAGRDSVSLEVHNLGPPIPVDEKLRLFQPMQRDVDRPRRASGRSVGLGLYIVKSIVEAHGARSTSARARMRARPSPSLPRRTPGRSPRPQRSTRLDGVIRGANAGIGLKRRPRNEARRTQTFRCD